MPSATCVGFVPGPLPAGTSIVQTFRLPERSLVKAIVSPSRDHVGSRSSENSVVS